jgi:hypothetical protein
MVADSFSNLSEDDRENVTQMTAAFALGMFAVFSFRPTIVSVA